MKSKKHHEPPLVSVVLPSYNHQDYVAKAIKGVLNQTYQNIEFLIIDDGSLDGSINKIQSLIDECRFRFARFDFISRENLGLCATLNQGLTWSKGEFFALTASDDVWLKNKIEKQIEQFHENPNVKAVFTGINVIDHDDKIKRKISKPGVYSFKDVFLSNFFMPSTSALIDIVSLKRIKFDPNFKIEDFNLWLKLAKLDKGELITIPDILVNYRRHSGNTSRRAQFMIDEGLRILAQYKDEPLYNRAVSAYISGIISSISSEDPTLAFKILIANRKYISLNPNLAKAAIKSIKFYKNIIFTND